MPNYLLGSQAKAYYSAVAHDGSNTDAVCSAGVEVGNIMDLSLEIESEYVDATTREEASQGFKSEIAVLKGGRITFEMRWKTGDTVFDALVAAWLAGAEFTFFALDQAKAVDGAQGLMANFSVGFSKTEPLRDVQKIQVTLSIASHPKWIVTDGTPDMLLMEDGLDTLIDEGGVDSFIYE